MADLALGAGRPFSLVTTVARRGTRRCRLAQLDVHLPSGDVRLRFLDTDALLAFTQAVLDLSVDAAAPDPLDYRPVRSRTYTEQDPFTGTPPRKASHPRQPSIFGDDFPF